MPTFEGALQDYLNNLKNYLRTQPVRLGGITSSGGGAGGPPGGFVGYLPQTRVAGDLSEAESATLPSSGVITLLDNLSNIRYRLHRMENGEIGTGIFIEKDGVEILGGITVLNFEGDNITLESQPPSGVRITISGTTSSGGGADISISENGTIVASAVTVIDFVGADVTPITGGARVTISGGSSPSGGIDVLGMQIFM